MATLLLDRAGLDVRTHGNALALYENGSRRSTVPLKLIDRVVIQGGQTRLDSSVLQKIAEQGATTLLLSPRHARRVALVLGPAHNDAAIRLAQARAVGDDTFCQPWAHRLVAAKLRRQQRTLQRIETRRPDARKALFDGRAALQHCLDTLHAQPSLPIASLRGVEGAGARAHFAALTAVFAPALNFAGRNRRPPRDPVNTCLSLGYTLLHFEAVRAAHIAGLDPLLGFYHRPSFGRESLAADLIEPLRPVVDHWVWRLHTDRRLRPEHFTRDGAACLLGKAGRGIFYAEWEKDSTALRRWLRRETRQLARHLRSAGTHLLAPDDDWDEADECPPDPAADTPDTFFSPNPEPPQ